MSQRESSDLVVEFTEPANPRVELLCVPAAAEGATRFFKWKASVGETVRLTALRLPGRESRLFEPCLRNIDDVVGGAIESLRGRTEPIAIFGLCSGAIIGYEIAHRIAAEAERPVVHLFPANQLAPARFEGGTVRSAGIWDERDPLNLSETSPQLAGDHAYMRAIRRALEADLDVLESFTYRLRRPLTCPITVISSEAGIDPDALRGWERESENRFEIINQAGNRLLDESWATLGALLVSRL